MVYYSGSHMEAADSSIVFNFESWNVRVQERKRDRMKLIVKLSKIEAEAFKNFMETVKPEQVSEDDFLKVIFRMGVEKMEHDLMQQTRKFVEENQESLAASGFDVSSFMDMSDDALEIVE